MSKFLRRLITPLATVVAILAMGSITPARADLEIWLSSTGTPTSANKVASAPSGNFPGASYTNANFDGVQINTLSVTSNSPGAPTGSNLLGATLNLNNTSGSTVTLNISMGDTGYTSPTTPPAILFTSHIGGTVNTAVAGSSLAFQSYVNNGPSGGQNATTGTPSGNPPVSPPITQTGSFVSDASVLLASLASGYSITETFAITLGAHESINFSTSSILAPTPEPSTLAITAVCGLGLIGYGLRRRKAKGA